MTYLEKLQNIIKKNNSHLVVGLDPDMEKIPDIFHKYRNPVAEFNKLIIEASKDLVAGYKPNVAFYESLGDMGLEALRETVASIPDEQIKICDAKRGDMGNTAEHYARAYFDNYNFDSITMSPYMGIDSIEPFIKREGKAVYILALTSNPGSEDFQRLNVDGKKLFEVVIEKSLGWSNNGNIGFVIGANHTTDIDKITSEHPDIPYLIPGIGAQKNDLNKLLESLHTKNFVINSSRGIIYSAAKECTETEFVESVRKAVVTLNESII